MASYKMGSKREDEDGEKKRGIGECCGCGDFLRESESSREVEQRLGTSVQGLRFRDSGCDCLESLFGRVTSSSLSPHLFSRDIFDFGSVPVRRKFNIIVPEDLASPKERDQEKGLVCLPSRDCIFEQLADSVSPLPCYSESHTAARYVFFDCIDVIYTDQGCDPRSSSFMNMIREAGLVFLYS